MITTEREALIERIKQMYQVLSNGFRVFNAGEYAEVPMNANTSLFHESREFLNLEFQRFETNNKARTFAAIADINRTSLSEIQELDSLLEETLAFVGITSNIPSVEVLLSPRGHLIEKVHNSEYPKERSEDSNHWLLTDDGFLEFHGGGWIKDKYGYIIGSDNEKIGAKGIQSGLEDLYADFSQDETQDDIINLMLDARLNYFVEEGKDTEDSNNWYWDLEENEGKRIPIPKEISDFLNMRKYNIDHNQSYTASNFLPDGAIQQGFSTGNVSYIDMKTSDKKPVLYRDTQVQLKYVHNGVDITGSGSIKSPGYYKVIQKAGHRLTLERVGTDRHTTIRHLDPTAVSALPLNKIFEPGESIISYPSSSQGPGSGIHIHVEENHLSGGQRYFCNPDTHSGAYPGSMYYLLYIIKKDGKEIKLPEIFHYAGETYRYYPGTNPR